MKRLAICAAMLCLLTAGCQPQEKSTAALSAPAEQPLLQYFNDTHPNVTVLKYAFGDVNDDKRDDLLVIYQAKKEQNEMLVVLDLPGGYLCTNAVPAPAENQQIQFKDIDNKPPKEMIVQGTKGAKAGYGIYRVNGAVLEDIFGEGMKDCCN